MSVTWPEGGVPPMAFPELSPPQRQLDPTDLAIRFENFLHDPDGILRTLVGFMRFNDENYNGAATEEVDLAAAIPAQPESTAGEEPRVERATLSIEQMRRALFANAITQDPSRDKGEEWDRANNLPEHLVALFYRVAFPTE